MGITWGSGSPRAVSRGLIGTGSGVETNVSVGKGATGLAGAPGATGGTSRGFSVWAGSGVGGSGGKLIGSGRGVMVGCASVAGGVGFWVGWESDISP